MIRSFISAVALSAVMLPTMAHANLVTNGSFESSTQANATWSIQSSVAGWSAGPAGLEIRNNVVGAAYDGSNFVELDTTANSSIRQGIQTGSGLDYLLSFAYSPRTGVSAASNGISAYWNDVLIEQVTGSNATGGNDWKLFEFTVRGTGGLDELRFSAVGTSDSLGGSLDAVSVIAAPVLSAQVLSVPEPGSAALFGIGLAGVAWMRRRARQIA